MLPYLRASDLLITEEGFGARDVLDRMIGEFSEADDKDAFYVADLGDVVKKHLRFLKAMPRVKPFYAVSCNSSRGVLQTLAELGAGFDCFSKTEIELVRGLGVSPERIIYANPCKQPSHIKHAARSGVRVMTFDNEEELVKVSASHPNARMVLRIVTEDINATFPLSEKFGAPLEECRHLLEVAKSLDVEIIGVSFHVGTACREPQNFTQPIADAQRVFVMAEELGQQMHLLDIGGGFPGVEEPKLHFEEFATVINTALDKHFPEGCGVEVIAEPGRYYVESAFTLAANIIAKKNAVLEQEGSEDPADGSIKRFMYYLNDGMFGSFNSALFEDIQLRPVPQKTKPSPGQALHTSSLWGPTCDCADRVVPGLKLPELQVGDWLIFNNMGAYSVVTSTRFNGFTPARIYYCMPQMSWTLIQLVEEPPTAEDIV